MGVSVITIKRLTSDCLMQKVLSTNTEKSRMKILLSQYQLNSILLLNTKSI